MEFLFYAATVVIAFIGLIVGAILSFISPEEMPTGKKYFPLLQRLILIAILAFFINLLGLSLPLRIIAYVAAVAYILTTTNTIAIYPLIAVLLFFSSSNPNSFFTLTLLTFLYGLPSGSLYAATAKASKYNIITTLAIKHILFLVIALALPFLFRLF
jgi:hypothetical protein